jgi:hypothetical protein
MNNFITFLKNQFVPKLLNTIIAKNQLINLKIILTSYQPSSES